MGVVEDMADQLAVDVLAAEAAGDGAAVDEIAKTLEASSTAAFEAYMASIRARKALTRARAMLEARLEAARSKSASAAPGPDGQPDAPQS